ALDATEVLRLFSKHFLRGSRLQGQRSPIPPPFDLKLNSSHRHYGRRPWEFPRFKPGPLYTRDRNTQHIYLGILFPLPGMFDRRRFAVNVIHQWLASGMASHLYRLVREELGLVYYIGGQLASFVDMGFYLIEASAEPKLMPEVLEVVLGELKKLPSKSWSGAWLNNYRQMVLKQLWMVEHEGEGRMQSLGMNELFWGRPWSIEEYVKFYEDLSLRDIREVAKHNLGLSQARVYLYGQKASWFGPYVKGLLPPSSGE
ncbi:MAG: insulinase family protein, partial [Bdellovibrionaceae bacterium]|nr:insulinase family protein [Pseudobdellovibrionaceae bacterium]